MKALTSWADAIEGAAKEQARTEAVEKGPERPPEGLSPLEVDLWYVEKELHETQAEMGQIRRQARAGGSLHGLTTLGNRFDGLLKRRAELRPPAPPSTDDEERKWRATADLVLAKIREGVKGRRAAKGTA